jgi:hypothetical protein
MAAIAGPVHKGLVSLRGSFELLELRLSRSRAGWNVVNP